MKRFKLTIAFLCDDGMHHYSETIEIDTLAGALEAANNAWTELFGVSYHFDNAVELTCVRMNS